MSGENKKFESGWTIDSLKAHYDSLLTEIDLRYQQRFEAQQKATTDALNSAALAVAKAEENADKWRVNANEWRGSMMDREVKFLPRDEFKGILTEWGSWRTASETTAANTRNRLTVIETRSITWTSALAVLFTVVQLVMIWVLRGK